MIKCEDKCVVRNKYLCCHECGLQNDCKEVCLCDPATCGDAVFDTKEDEVRALELVVGPVISSLKEVVRRRKAAEQEEAECKGAIMDAMERLNVKSYKKDDLSVSYVSESVSSKIDAVKLKKEYPDVAKECSVLVFEKPYLKVGLQNKC